MKTSKLLLILCALLLSFCLAGAANAASLQAGVEPDGDAQGNVIIPQLPNGKLVQVYVWNDDLGAQEQKLGPVHTFKLNPGDGFNFTWSGPQGTNWQRITSSSKPGGSLVVDTSWKDEKGIVRCKYLFPGK